MIEQVKKLVYLLLMMWGVTFIQALTPMGFKIVVHCIFIAIWWGVFVVLLKAYKVLKTQSLILPHLLLMLIIVIFILTILGTIGTFFPDSSFFAHAKI